MRSFDRTIAAGEETRIAARGRTVFLRQASSGVILTVRSNEVGKKDGVDITVPLSERQKLVSPRDFDDVTLRNDTAGSIDVQVLIGYGDYDAPLSSVSVAAANAVQDIADTSLAVGTTDNIAANAARRAITVFAMTTNTGARGIRVGAAVTDTRGYELVAGAAYTFTTTAAIQVRNPSTNAVAQSYGYIEEYDV